MQGPAGSNRVGLLSLNKKTIISPCAGPWVLGVINKE